MWGWLDMRVDFVSSSRIRDLFYDPINVLLVFSSPLLVKSFFSSKSTAVLLCFLANYDAALPISLLLFGWNRELACDSYMLLPLTCPRMMLSMRLMSS
jgi:hypothetical protein